MPAIFFASSRPPTRPSAICRIDAAPVSSTRANSCLVASRSPVAIGIEVWSATRAISRGFSGGVGSSSQSGSYFSSRRARRIALGGERGVAVDIARVARLGIEIGIAAQPLVDAAAEQLVDRLAEFLADDVPARHLDA